MLDVQLALQIAQTILSVILIGAVILHSAKGEGIGAIGGQAKIFGSQKGVEAGLNRFATAVALLWGLVSLVLAFLSYHR
ncbi:MAG: preprotein translocase subunit SecG [Candidatus Sericytochromatia bacterium]|nr:preprotein translocase subunit SecG [Candidatus Sericytochromatia bacterium]